MFKRFWPALLITPPITLGLGYFLAAVITFLMPKRFESTAGIEILAMDTPLELAVEMRKLTQPDHFALAAHNLDLPARWGVDTESAIRLLEESVACREIPGTGHVQIRVRHTHREDAKDIANALIYAYRSIREGYDLETIQRTLHELEVEMMNQEILVHKLHQERVARGGTSRQSSSSQPTRLDLQYEEASARLMTLGFRFNSHPFPALSESQGGVVVHDAPLIADAPFSPNIPFNLSLGALSGMLLGFPLALGIMAILHRLRPARC